MRSCILSCLAFVLLTGSVYGGEQSAASRSVWREAKRTPLHQAASNGNEGVVGLLVSRGADVTMRDREGRTSLDLVRWRRDARLEELLTPAGDGSGVEP